MSLSHSTASASTENRNRPFICKECDKCYTRKHNLKAHLRSHSSERPYACTLCGLNFRTYDQSYSHRNRVHPRSNRPAKRYACQCHNLLFSRPFTRDRHEKDMKARAECLALAQMQSLSNQMVDEDRSEMLLQGAESLLPLPAPSKSTNVQVVEGGQEFPSPGFDFEQQDSRPMVPQPSKLSEKSTCLAIGSGTWNMLFADGTFEPHCSNNVWRTAAQFGHSAALQYLCKAHVNVDIRFDSDDYRGVTALHVVAKTGEASAIETLLELGANVDAKDSQDRTPLYLAAEFGRNDSVILLLSHGSNPCAQDSKGYTPLTIAALNRHLGTYESLLSRTTGINFRNRIGESLLHIVSKFRDARFLQLAVDRGADFYSTNDLGRNSLHWVAYYNSIACMKLLLEKNSRSATEIDRNGLTPLHLLGQSPAPGNGDILEGINLLVTNGGDINAIDGFGRTPLIYWITYRIMYTHRAELLYAMVKHAIVEHRADVNVINSAGETALDVAWSATSHPFGVEYEKNQHIVDMLRNDFGAKTGQEVRNERTE